MIANALSFPLHYLLCHTHHPHTFPHAVGKATKRRLESAYHEYGYRTGWQVISNSFSALVACVLWNAIYAPDSLPGWIFGSLLRSPEFTTHPALVHAPPYTSPAHPDPRWCPATPYPAPTG